MPRPIKELVRLLTELGERGPETFETEDRALFAEFREAANLGLIRAAERDERGEWQVNLWFKKALLAGFKLGQVFESDGYTRTPFFDKHTLPTRALSGAHRVRFVPGGSAIRDGAYVGENVIVMPPSYINVGAWIGPDTLVDSHVLVGSCAQIGARVHLSAGVQIGGVLEPIGTLPVIVEDEVIVGGNCGIYEGAIVKRGAVIGTGVVLNGSTPVYDLVREQIYRRDGDRPLVIPENAVVIPGSRVIRGAFAESHGLTVSTPIIRKYKDEKTDAATALEEALR
jgi:2,3,4,5-tetrahydropyridine-2,6-dicarboxylate N-succinyltransferase